MYLERNATDYWRSFVYLSIVEKNTQLHILLVIASDFIEKLMEIHVIQYTGL
jgi:hypothetical protein